MHKPIVTIVGHVCLDHNSIDGVTYKSWGSSAMYIAKYLAKEFGIKPHIVSSYGSDFIEYTTEFTFIGELNDHKTLLYENIVNNGNRLQFCHHSDFSPPIEVNADLKDLLKKTDILIVAPMLANYDIKYIEQIMEHLPATTLRVLLPQGYMRHINEEYKIEKRAFIEAKHILKHFDAVIASDEDHDNALEAARGWAAYKNGSSIVITQAEKGATVFYADKITRVATTPLPFSEIKNPVGSGDIFSAQFTMSLHSKLHPHEAVSSANKATAKALLSDHLQ